MSGRLFDSWPASPGSMSAALAIVALSFFSFFNPAPPAALAQGLEAGPYTPPRTPWGDPDLRGLWPGNAGVPMQRPPEFEERTTLNDAEFARREAGARSV